MVWCDVFLVRCLSFGAVVGCDVVLVPCLGSVEKVGESERLVLSNRVHG